MVSKSRIPEGEVKIRFLGVTFRWGQSPDTSPAPTVGGATKFPEEEAEERTLGFWGWIEAKSFLRHFVRISGRTKVGK
jgi:hypothetical protein